MQNSLLCLGLGARGVMHGPETAEETAPPAETGRTRPDRGDLVGRGSARPFADIADFRKGEDLLEVTILAGAVADEVEVEIVCDSEAGASRLLANGQLLAVLRGVPDAGFDDFRISVEPAQAESGTGWSATE